MDGEVAVLLNAKARRVNHRVVDRVSQVLPRDNIFVSNSLDEAKDMTREIMARSFETVVAGGGDGTLVTFFKHSFDYVDRTGRNDDYPLLGVLKLGTGNGISSYVGAGKYHSDLVALTREPRPKERRRLSLIEVEGQYCPFAGFGLDANILNDYVDLKDTWLGKRFKYAFTVPASSVPKQILLRRKYPVGRIINEGGPASLIGSDGEPTGEPIETGQTIYHGPLLIAGVATMPYYGYGMKLYPFVERRGGTMQLRISWASTYETLSRLPEIWDGSYRSDKTRDYYCDKVRMVFDRETPFQIGGEGIGRRQEVTFTLSRRTVDLIQLKRTENRLLN